MLLDTRLTGSNRIFILNVMDGSTVVVPFGDTVYTKIVADNSYEAINVRVTDCWATETTGYFIKK